MLCETCRGFDVHRLLKAATAEKGRKSDGSYPAVPKFYTHYNGISALKSSAENGCELCRLLWTTACDTVKQGEVDRWLQTEEGELQIYLESSPWSPRLQGLPYVVVTQYPSQSGSRSLGSFEAYAERGSVPPDSDGLLARNVYDDPSSTECLALAAEWLQTCLKDHKNCLKPSPAKSALPTRVIDVGPSDGSINPKVVIANSRRGDYVALSYCWGGNSSFVLKLDSTKLYNPQTPADHFPETIRDAIRITRKLDIRFLWVDALCILQDSKEDWVYEAAKMRDVYKGAIVTIAAANSPNSFHGILNKRAPSGPSCKIHWDTVPDSDDHHVFLRTGSHLWDNTMQSSPLNSRGWTLQEGLLAPRTISYGPQQMFWECPSCQTDEGGRTTQATQKYREKKFMQDMVNSNKNSRSTLSKIVSGFQQTQNPQENSPHDRWFDIIFQYTGRHLTNDTDMLPALSGIAQEFQRLTGDRYLAGLWQKDLIRGILWDRFPVWPNHSRGSHGEFDETKPTTYRAPTWSWASVNGQHVSFTDHAAVKRAGIVEKQAKIVRVQTKPASDDHFGQVAGGSLTLKAPFHIISDFRVDPPTKTQTRAPKLDALMCQWWRDIASFRYLFQQAHEDCKDQHFALVQVLKWSQSPATSNVPGLELLLLESTGTERKNEYRRLWHPQLRRENLPKEEEPNYGAVSEEVEAWDEVVGTKWRAKTVVIV